MDAVRDQYCRGELQLDKYLQHLIEVHTAVPQRGIKVAITPAPEPLREGIAATPVPASRTIALAPVPEESFARKALRLMYWCRSSALVLTEDD